MSPKAIVMGFIAVMFVGIGVVYTLNPFGAKTEDPRGRVLGIVPYRVGSESMAPTFRTGDLLVADVRNPRAAAQRGNVILFESPVDPGGNVWLTRVVAVGGDRIAIADGVVTLNGVPLAEPYADWSGHARALEPMAEITIPDGHVFTLGDNRGNSNDGRYWGSLPIGRITGVATSVGR